MNSARGMLIAPLVLLAACAPGPAAEPGPDPGHLPRPVPISTLNRDERMPGVVTLPEQNSPFVAFDIWVRAGSQNDPEGKEGLAVLTAMLLSEGSTTEHSYEEVVARLYPMAAGYDASVDKEMTVFRGVVHRDNLDAYYELLRNAITSPAFRPDDFERVKTQLLNYVERTRRFARDEELSRELLFSMAYAGTPYEHPEEGYVESVRSLTLDDVRRFWSDHYVRNNIVTGLGGGYPRGFVQRVRADFDALPEKPVSQPPRPAPRMPDGVEVLLVEKQTDASPISIGFPIDVTRGHSDFHALMLANSWLGEHRNSFSHLYQVIRETRGMNYGDYSYIEAFPLAYTTQQPPVNAARRSHLFEIWIRPISSTAPGNLHDRTLFATRAALREFEELVEEGLPAAEVERTRNFLHNYSVNWGNTISRRLAYRIDDAFYGIGGDGFLASVRPGIARLDSAAVGQALRRHLQTDAYYIVIITQDAEALKRKLVSGEPTPITYAGDQPAALLAEDREIAAFPLNVRAENVRIVPIEEVFERSP